MRLTIRTSLAMRALMYCAANPGRTVRKHDIAEACKACRVSENHLAQVVHALGQKGFLATQRGRSGGLRLGRPMQDITVGQVFRALEAEVPFAECFGADTECPLRPLARRLPAELPAGRGAGGVLCPARPGDPGRSGGRQCGPGRPSEGGLTPWRGLPSPGPTDI